MQRIANAVSAAHQEYIKRNIKSDFIDALKKNDDASIERHFERGEALGDTDFTRELVQLLNSHKAAQAEAGEAATKIQSILRGRQGRLIFSEKREEALQRANYREIEKEQEELAKWAAQKRLELFKDEMKQYIKDKRNLDDWVRTSEFSSLTGGDKNEDGTFVRQSDEYVRLWSEALSEEVKAGNLEPEDTKLLTSIEKKSPGAAPPTRPRKFEVKDEPYDFLALTASKKIKKPKRRKSKKKSKKKTKKKKYTKKKKH